MQDLAPIVTLDKVKLNQIGNAFSGSVTVKAYWAEFPKKIPAITQAIGDFTDQEMDIILRISRLFIPPFTNINPSEESGREDPFQ